jgi:hypothetical protein
MPLLRGIARTAAIAGTATAVSNRVSRRQAGRWAKKGQQGNAEPAPPYAQPPPQYAQPPPQYAQPPQYAPQPAAPAADTMDDKLAQLKRLGELKEQGVLTEAEFAAQKQRILG